MAKQARAPHHQAHLDTMKRIRAEASIAVDHLMNQIEPQVWERYQSEARDGVPVSAEEIRSIVQSAFQQPLLPEGA